MVSEAIQLFSYLILGLRGCGSTDAIFDVHLTVRTNKAAHILYNAQHFHVHLAAKVEFFTNGGQGHLLGRGDDNSTIWPDILQSFDHRQVFV